MKIQTKILIAFTSVAIIAVSVIGFFAFTTGSSTLEEESFNKLTAVREMKANQIEDYFQLIENQVITMSEDPTIIEAMRAFDDGLHEVGDDLGVSDFEMANVDDRLENYYEQEFLPRLIPNLLKDVSVGDYWPEDKRSRILQDLYIASNPFETGSKLLLDDPGDGSSYSQAHEIYHPVIRNFLEKFGYYDIFLVDVDTGGHIAYSVYKEVDYATSLLDGPYADTNFADAYNAARGAGDKDFVKIVDYEPYPPSYNAPASFIASPIFDGDEKIGVLVFQMPIDRINGIMTNDQNWSAVGLGESGETYLVGQDFKLRNQSRFLIENSEKYFKLIEEIGIPLTTIARIRNLNSTIGLQEVKTDGTEAALSGLTGTGIFPDYRGVPVLSSYKPLNIPGMNWVIMSEIDQAEAFAGIRSLGTKTFFGVVVLIGVIILMAVLFSKTITRPLDELTGTADELAKGNLDVEVACTDQGDEIGVLACSFDAMRISMKDLIGDLEDVNQNLEQKVLDRTAELEQSRKEAEDAKARLEAASEASEVGIWDHNLQTGDSYFSPSYFHLLGYEEDEFPQTIETFNNLIHPDDKDRNDSIVDDYLSKGDWSNYFESEFRLRSKDSGWRWMLSRGKGVEVDEKGEPLLLIGANFDITTRKEAEEQLNLQSAALNAAANGIVITDPEGRIQWVNPAYTNLTGYTLEEVVGQNPRISKSGKHDQSFYKKMWETITSGQVWQGEMINKRKDGTLYPEEMTITPVCDGNGVTINFVAIKQDITKRKKLEEEIAKQLSFTQALVDTIPNPMYVKGVDTKFLTFNQEYEHAFGINRDDYIGKTVLDMDFIPMEAREAYQEESLDLLQSGGKINREVQITYSDEKTHDVIYQVKSFDLPDGSRAGLMGLETDISPLKELERQLERANERMSTELNFARDIQMSMLPLIFPAFPERKEVSVYATLEQAREVGGDFYDFYFIDDDHLCFVIGDVSGKGAPGALLMAVSKTLIKSRAADDLVPASILTHVNDELSQDNQSSMFVTVFLGVINIKTGVLEYTNAGHNPPYIKRRDGTVEKVGAFHGPVIGAMPGMPYKQDSTRLSKGDIILVYTDGVTETFNEEDQLFSEERLADMLLGDGLDSTEQIIKTTLSNVKQFQGEAEQADDVTVLAVQYHGLLEEVEYDQLNINIKNRLADVGVVEEQFYEFAQENGIPDTIRQKVSIVLDEMLNNIISYAYQDDEEHDIELDIDLSGNRLVTTITDDGIPFNPFGLGAPDVAAAVDEREVGGLGIHLVRSVMDEYLYQRQINKNVVTLVKFVED